METQIQLRPDRKKFKIEITEILEHDYISEDTKKIESRHYTDEEMREQHQYMRSKDNIADFKKDIYGKVAELKTQEYKTVIYTQTVADLLLPQVIKAINGI